MLSEEAITNILSYIQNPSIEIEVRFGRFDVNNRYIPGVTYESFIRLMYEFVTNFDLHNTRYTITDTVDYIHSDSGVIRTGDKYTQKTRLYTYTSQLLPFRLSISHETSIPPVPNFVSNVTRSKKRTSFPLRGGDYRLDLTVVNNDSYEIELEIYRFDLQVFTSIIQSLIRRIYNTNEIYTIKDRSELIQYIVSTLGSTDILPSYQRLRFDDIVNGGIIGSTLYKISYYPNSDDRRLLVFHPSGIWLYHSIDRIDRVLNANIPNLNGFILDGYLIPKNMRRPGAPVSKYWFLILDCLSSPQNRHVQTLPHRTRMDYCQSAKDLYTSNTVLELTTMSFTTVTTGQEVFSNIRTMLDRRDSLVYSISGLLFVPDTGNRYLLWTFERYLNLQIRRTLTTLELHTSKGKYSGIDIDYNNPVIQGLPDMTIVKYRWDPSSSLWIPVTPRFDLTRPDNYDYIDNIPESVLRGDTLEFMKVYHDQTLIDTINSMSVSSVIDMTTNRTDLYLRYLRNSNSINRVVIIEPNPEVYKGLASRVRSNNIQVVNYNYNDITSVSKVIDKVDLVVFDGNVVDYDTIGMYIQRYSPQLLLYIAIDGDIVRHIFLPSGIGNGLDLKDLELGGRVISYDKTLSISGRHIPLFRSDNILIRFPRYRIRYKRQLSPLPNVVLSNAESVLSSMYTYGVIVNTNDEILYIDNGYSFIKLVIGTT